jgi:16S rRNA G527 N7-methylase RsmG
MQSSKLIDRNLHKAIDLQQILLLELEILKQHPEVTRADFDLVLERAIGHVVECSDILHEVRKEGNIMDLV